jgi:APA family basic amino acid/polyamine antiporter
MSSQGNQQKRVLGLGSATSTVVCNMIGAGIFTTTGLHAAELGSSSAIMTVWLVAGVLALCGTLSIIELANIWPEAGGTYIFIRNIFGRPAGFVAGFSIAFFGIVGSISIMGGAFGFYFNKLLPSISPPLAASLAVCLVTAIHSIGVREGNVINLLGAFFKIGLLLAFITFGFSSESTAVLAPASSIESGEGILFGTSAAALGAALAATSFAYQGNMATSFIGGEILNPEKNLRRSMIIGVSIVTLLYLAVNMVFLWAAAPHEMINANGEGIVEIGFFVANRLFGESIGVIANVLIMLVFFLTLGVAIMIGSRVIYSMASRGELPSRMAQLNRRGSPVNALVLQCILSLALIWVTGLKDLLESVGTLVTLTTGVAITGVIVLRIRKPNLHRPVKLPLFPLPPIVFLLLTAWMTWGVLSTNPTSVILILGIVALGLVVWFGFANNYSREIGND